MSELTCGVHDESVVGPLSGNRKGRLYTVDWITSGLALKPNMLIDRQMTTEGRDFIA
jgi:hypothetical protein